MALTRNFTHKSEIPHEPGQHMTFRLPDFLLLQRAREEKQSQLMASVKKLGVEAFQALQKIQAEVVTVASATEPDPLAQYDIRTLLEACIVEWSYPVSPKEGVKELDEETAEWAAREILKFHTALKANRGNG